jgi:uncharacterized repeat protein (TIGR03803 family)
MRTQNVRLAGLCGAAFILLSAIQAQAQTLTTLCSFNGITSSGASPAAVVTVNGSTVYVTAEQGGNLSLNGGLGYGTVFSVATSGGNPTVVCAFNGYTGNGQQPMSGVVVNGSTLYGTTFGNPSINTQQSNGTVFSVPVAGGTPTTLGVFNYSNGQEPEGRLILNGSTLYGTTYQGGNLTANNPSGYGEVFSIPISGGSPTTLCAFSGSNGANPVAGLTLSGSTLYGTTKSGGAYGDGVVFSVPIGGGTPTVLCSFSGSNGSSPQAGLVLVGSTLFGTTYGGGTNGGGTVFSIATSGGNPTVLASMIGNPLDLALSGGTLFGTTHGGGTLGVGSVFSIATTGGNLTTLSSFNYSNGYEPVAGLTISGMTAYGTTFGGGSGQNSGGTVFAFNFAPATVVLSSSSNATIITGGSTAIGMVVSNSPTAGYNLNYAISAGIVGGNASLGPITSGTGTLSPGGSQSCTVAATSTALGNTTLSFTASDPNSTNLSRTSTATLTVLAHTAPGLSVTSGNNQTVIVGAAGVTAGLTLSNGTLSQTGLASLDVNSLGTLVTGTTGGKLVASGTTRSYTVSLTAGTIGSLNEAFSLNVGDDHTLSGASAPFNITTTAALTVLGHATPVLVTSSGNNQSLIIGATTATVGLTLYDGATGQSGLAALDVNSLGAGVSGGTGAKLVASGSAGSYTATLGAGSLGTQTQVFSLNAGDDHTLLGAAAATNLSASATFTVLGHAAPSSV